MKLSPFRLTPRLSAVSVFSIELFALTAVFFLPFSKSAAETTILVSVGLWALRKFPWDEAFPRVPLCSLVYPLLLALVFLSLAASPPGRMISGLRDAAKWLKYLGIFFMAAEVFSERRRAGRLAVVFLVSMGLVCADGLYQMAAGTDLVKKYSVDIPGRFIRMQGPFSSPNDLAAFFLFALPLAFFLWLEEKKWSLRSLGTAAMLALFGVCFIATLSRSAFLGLLAAALLYLFLKKNWKVLAIAALAPALLAVSPMLRYNFFGSLGLKDITVGERLEMWKVTLRMIAAHPWLGNGVNTYMEKFPQFAGGGSTYHGYAHNCYLQMTSELGIPALALFCVPLVFLVPGQILKNRAEGKFPVKTALLIAVPAFLFQAALDTNLYALQASTIFWIFWGALAGGTIAHPTLAGGTGAAVRQRTSSGG